MPSVADFHESGNATTRPRTVVWWVGICTFIVLMLLGSVGALLSLQMAVATPWLWELWSALLGGFGIIVGAIVGNLPLADPVRRVLIVIIASAIAAGFWSVVAMLVTAVARACWRRLHAVLAAAVVVLHPGASSTAFEHARVTEFRSGGGEAIGWTAPLEFIDVGEEGRVDG